MDKYRILKTKPRSIEENDFTPTTYGIIPQEKDKEGYCKPWKFKRLKIGDWYYMETDEPGQELSFTAEFLGWKKEIIDRSHVNMEDDFYYVAIFKAVSNIEVEKDYSLHLVKSEEQK